MFKRKCTIKINFIVKVFVKETYLLFRTNLSRIIKRKSIANDTEHFSKDFNSFVKKNEETWKCLDKENPKDENKYILVEGLVLHDGYLLTNLVIARYLMEIESVSAIGVLHNRNKRVEELFLSYGVKKFIFLEDRKRTLSLIIKRIFKVLRSLIKINNIDEFLDVKYNGIHLGKLSYDNYLRSNGVGTIEQLDTKLLKEMYTAISYHDYLDDIVKNLNAFAMVQSERQFIPYGVLFQTVVKHGLTVYFRGGGPTNFTLLKISDPSLTYMNTHRHSKEIFNYVYQNYKEKAVEIGGELIYSRFLGKAHTNDIPDASKAYKENSTSVSREELCSSFNWDSSKPIVLVMSNMLTDGVFTNRWRIFRDNLIWLRETLTKITEVCDVNWIVKGHPSDSKNNVKTTSKAEYERITGSLRNVRFLESDFPASSLPSIVDAVLTDHGSAGLEYPIMGVPCIIAGESLYSGRGFVYEPKSKDEYFKLLENVSVLKKPTNEQIDKAKVFVYIYLILARVKSSLIPNFRVFADYDENALWKEAEVLLNDFDLESDDMFCMLKKQVSSKDFRHLLYYDSINL